MEPSDHKPADGAPDGIPAYGPPRERSIHPVLGWVMAILVVLALGVAGAFGGCCVGVFLGMGMSADGTAVWLACTAIGLIVGLIGGGFLAGRRILRRDR